MPFVISASVGPASNDKLQMAVIDGKGLVRQYRGAIPDYSELAAYLETAATLPPGDHETTLEVRVCRDDPLVCNSPVTGSPLRVGLKIRAGSQGTLTPLHTVPGLQPWRTFNGNAAHTGFVPADFSPASFSRRWSLAGGTAGPPTAKVPALDNGRAFVTRTDKEGFWEVVAIDEATGEIAWRHPIDRAMHPNPPAAAHGSVYITMSSNLGTGEFASISQINGRLMFKAPLPSTDQPSSLAPSVTDDAVYVGLANGRMLSFQWRTSQLAYSRATLPAFPSWMPAIDANQAYVSLAGRLYVLSTADGSLAYEMGDEDVSYSPGPPLLGPGKVYVATGLELVAFDLQTRTRAWSRSVGPGVQPALGSSALYAIIDRTWLEAIDPATGASLWRASNQMIDRSKDEFRRVIVSNNLAFLTGWTRTVAVDLTTRQVVWSYPLGGDLAISDRGVLYIASLHTGRVDAINLR